MIFVINPGSTSTKIALFDGEKCVFDSLLEHSRSKRQQYARVIDQAEYREQLVRKELKKHKVDLADIKVFMARGGLLKPLKSGVYAIDKAMLKDLKKGCYGEHASNLGAVIADALAKDAGCGAYIFDSVVLDEMDPVARLSGYPDIPRRSVFHSLNQKAMAVKAVGKLSKSYDESRLIVVHVGGGVSVGIHKNGKVIDVNNALEGDGPFSVERTGGLPLLDFYRYVTKKKMSLEDVEKMVTREGGLYAYLGTNDFQAIEKKVQAGDEKYRLVYDAFAYQLIKAIGAGAAVLGGKVDVVVLTGAVVKSRWLCSRIKQRISFISPVFVFPGNLEMETLAHAGQDVLDGGDVSKYK
ncbi:MAG: butyrate kinase [Kiritimatiellae bacterium]|nr:butyrate kinase [Kiritimatiellia bacterium]